MREIGIKLSGEQNNIPNIENEIQKREFFQHFLTPDTFDYLLIKRSKEYYQKSDK